MKRKILFLAQHKWPHIGGVETHIRELTKNLELKSNIVRVISEEDIRYPHIKLFGLLYIWFWLFKNKKLIESAGIIHCHDVFIWYLPFRFLYLGKKVFTTIHGLEWDNPLTKISIWQKKLASKLSAKTIGVGDFLEKYLKVKFDLIAYGGTTIIRNMVVKKKGGNIVFVGRLEKDTGVLKFLKWLKAEGGLGSAGERSSKRYQVDFAGDGTLRRECEKYGEVHGFTDPTPFYKKAEYCVPGGYLAALEALQYNCKLKLFWDSKIKEDYWKMSPFVRKDVKVWAKRQTWDKLADEYIYLYNSIK